MKDCLSAALVFVAATTLTAQDRSSSSPDPSFEVAAIKVNDSGDSNARLNAQPGGRVTAQNVPLESLIRTAYQVQRLQIEGVPDWAASTRYDITAKAEGDVPPNTLALMLRSLLHERFKLAVRWETREVPVYALVPARADRSLGPQMKPVSGIDCEELRKAGTKPPPTPAPTPADPNPVGPCSQRSAPGVLRAGAANMRQLAASLTNFAGRFVVDRTELQGSYDLELKWVEDPSPERSGPSLFTALPEQLGLKLDSQRAPVELLVIDHVERPIPD